MNLPVLSSPFSKRIQIDIKRDFSVVGGQLADSLLLYDILQCDLYGLGFRLCLGNGHDSVYQVFG